MAVRYFCTLPWAYGESARDRIPAALGARFIERLVARQIDVIADAEAYAWLCDDADAPPRELPRIVREAARRARRRLVDFAMIEVEVV